jgi:hypothetical protein
MGHVNGLLPEKTILDIDVEIVKASDVVVFYNHEGQYSRGMMVEKAAVDKYGIEWIEVDDLVDMSKLACAIRKAIRRLFYD